MTCLNLATCRQAEQGRHCKGLSQDCVLSPQYTPHNTMNLVKLPITDTMLKKPHFIDAVFIKLHDGQGFHYLSMIRGVDESSHWLFG